MENDTRTPEQIKRRIEICRNAALSQGKEILERARNARRQQLKETFWERFWIKINKNGPVPPHRPQLGKCWEWKCSVNESGYGQMKRNGKAEMCHRLSFENTNGNIPDQLQVLHQCDNPRCVNPAHLFLGTPQINVDDCVSKNRRRYAHGQSHYRSKLTDEQVLEIRTLYHKYAANRQCGVLAAQFGITNKQQLYQIACGRRRKL